MNRTTEDEVKVKVSALADVLECHDRKGGRISRDLIIREGRNRVLVRRNQLWNLIQEHGVLCELKERPLV